VAVWRRRILSAVAWSYLGLGAIAAVIGISVAISHDIWSVVVFDTIALLVGAGLVLCPERFYRLKSISLIMLTYTVGGYFSYQFGPFAAGPLWLFAGPMLSGALFGWRAALGSVGFLVIVLFTIGALLARGSLNWPGELGVGVWFVISSSLVALSGLLSVSIGVLLDGVARANREREDAIEARELLEQQLRHSQKMEAVGRLAGGIAHDFNNLLVAISGFTEFAMDTLEDDSSAVSDLSEVMDAVTRAKALTEQLLTFSRKNTLAPNRIDINASIRDASRLLEQLSREHIRLHIKLCTEPCSTKIDPDSLIQILVNAATNAADAMPEGGEITIETSRVQVDGSSSSLDDLEMEPGEYAVVSVTDTGSGIAEDTLERIFEPFFTTKKTGEGTGLGLSTSWAVVKQVGGYIHMTSELGRGSTLKCFFHFTPWVAPKIDQARVMSQSRGNERILVVEDDEQVRKMLIRSLQAKGYEVLDASHAKDALALAQQPQIDLLVTDVIMPGLNGRELAAKVAELHPKIAVLYVSGYSDDILTQKGILDDGLKLLKKPFQLDVLTKLVRELLDARS
jgi:signal transduction histidine kinase/ActR/RegA family two-component response regulator